MCLYSDGCRTPNRAATAASVRFDNPTSSAITSPSSITRVCVSPALGTIAQRLQKADHRIRGDFGLLRLGIVAGSRHDDRLAVKRLGDPGGFCLRVAEVGVLVAHHHQGRRIDVLEARLGW